MIHAKFNYTFKDIEIVFLMDHLFKELFSNQYRKNNVIIEYQYKVREYTLKKKKLHDY